ncbi:PP2C family serine/threonine-protein phosphatase [Siccibacter turicensis]
MKWCYASASAIGSSHLRSGTRLQDARRCFVTDDVDGAPWFVAIVSDGAGSASFGGQGASLVCHTLGQLARSYLADHAATPDDATLSGWIAQARTRIDEAARARALTPRDFAATLVMLMVSPETVLVAHVGDGAVVCREKTSGEWRVASAPQHGEYASTTFFITDAPGPRVRFTRLANDFSAFAAFSDGIESLVIDSASGRAAPGFFTPMARPLDSSQATGNDLALSRSLTQFLASPRLNERTDDDKTLVIAVSK